MKPHRHVFVHNLIIKQLKSIKYKQITQPRNVTPGSANVTKGYTTHWATGQSTTVSLSPASYAVVLSGEITADIRIPLGVMITVYF